MKDRLRRFVVGNRLLSWIYFLIIRTLNRSAITEIKKRALYSLYDYRALAKPLRYYPLSIIKDNCYYGTSAAIQKAFPKLNLKTDCLIEHGLIFGSFVQRHVNYSHARNIVTFSNYRKDILCNKLTKRVYTIGPYIDYVDDLLDNDALLKEKEKLGTVLLVFPTHSIDGVEASFDTEMIIKEIEIRKVHFDTVLVCLYWKDIILKKAREYESMGYKITTAGHAFDHYFLNRLRSIIKLADQSMSNNIGTHVGYCITLGKPHYIFQQNIIQQKLDKNYEREVSQRNTVDLISYEHAKKEISLVFNSFSNIITDEMTEMIEKYWGKSKLI